MRKVNKLFITLTAQDLPPSFLTLTGGTTGGTRWGDSPRLMEDLWTSGGGDTSVRVGAGAGDTSVGVGGGGLWLLGLFPGLATVETVWGLNETSVAAVVSFFSPIN